MGIKKLKKQTTFKEDAGKLLLDLGKLVFGGIKRKKRDIISQ